MSTHITVMLLFFIAGILVERTQADGSSKIIRTVQSAQKTNEEQKEKSEYFNTPVAPREHHESQRKSALLKRQKILKSARTEAGSIHESLRTDYLLTITLPWTLGMFLFIALLMLCMRTNGWLYKLFTEDYVPPAVKKRLEEEARRAQGKKARLEREDNWNEIKSTWASDLKARTRRVKATMPPTR